MSAIDTLRAALFGDPPTSGYTPSREGVLAAFIEMYNAISTITTGGLADISFATIAAMNADLAHASGVRAIVYDDPVPANNDIWVKTGASGSGSWILSGSAGIIHDTINALAQTYVDNAAASAAAAQSTTLVGIGNSDPVNNATNFDTLTANNRNTITYVEAGSGTNRALFPIPNRAEGSVLTVLVIPGQNNTGGIPFLGTQHTDNSFSTPAIALANATSPQLVTLTVPAGKTAKAVSFGVTGACAGTVMLAIQDGDKNAAMTVALQGSGFKGAMWSLFLQMFGLLGLSSISDQKLREWVMGDNWQAASGDPAVGACTVRWPDLSGGTYTPTFNATWGGLDSFTITHTLSNKTVTQPTMTRNSNGRVTTTPALTIS